MKRQKVITFILTALIATSTLSISVYAHPGKTDSKGGHWDRKKGTYHYHNGGSTSGGSGYSSSNKANPPVVYNGGGNYSTPNKSNTPAKTGSDWVKENGVTKYYNYDINAWHNKFTQIESKWYFFDSSGVMQTGWIKINKDIYYFDKNGVMLTGDIEISGVKYTFSEYGKLATSSFPTITNVQTSEKVPKKDTLLHDGTFEFDGDLFKQISFWELYPEWQFEKNDFITVKGKLVGGNNEKVTLVFTNINPNGDTVYEKSYYIKSGDVAQAMFIPYTFLSENRTGEIIVSIEETGQVLASYTYEIVDAVQ